MIWLPRRATLPTNVGHYAMHAHHDEDDEDDNVSQFPNWDILDYLAVLGCVAAIAGLVLALWPATRSGSILVPTGLGLMAFAAYAARRRDGQSA
jgi:hypothetical protein